MKKDIYKLDARVTIMLSQAQVNALREIARLKQTNISALIRGLVSDELETNNIWNYAYGKQINVTKGDQDD